MGIVIAVVLLIVILTVSAKHKVSDTVFDYEQRQFQGRSSSWKSSVTDMKLDNRIEEWMLEHQGELFGVVKSFTSDLPSWRGIKEEDFPIHPSSSMSSNWFLVKMILMAKHGKLPHMVLYNGIRATVTVGKYPRLRIGKEMSESLFLKIAESLKEKGAYSTPIIKIDGFYQPLDEYIEENGIGAAPDNSLYTWAALCLPSLIKTDSQGKKE